MNIILGISGSIAACKAPELITLLKDAGHTVRVILTKNGAQFTTALTCKALTGEPIYEDFEHAHSPNHMDHIALARWCDLLLIAPATAHVLASCAQGSADDLLATVFLATKARVFIAPAMNHVMWHHAATQKNVAYLRSLGVDFLGPDTGQLACGEFGPGRMLAPAAIAMAVQGNVGHQLLAGKSVLITAGATQEVIDPVRYLTNHSSGRMGLALAQAALEQGAQVTCILGPCALPIPAGIEVIRVQSAEAMYHAVVQNLSDQDWFIGCAAVADYTPETVQPRKLKKSAQTLTLKLKRTQDIITAVSQHEKRPKTIIGFAAETDDLINNAQAKLTAKGCDIIVANQAIAADAGMGQTDNAVIVISATEKISIAKTNKSLLAKQLIPILVNMLAKQATSINTITT